MDDWERKLRDLGVICIAGAAVFVGGYVELRGLVGAHADASPDAQVSRGTLLLQEGRGGYLVLDDRSPVEVVAPRQLHA